ncbi:hypothetical protein HY408_00870 [Candidatus Gottesmanbacteria bacterium]|nr:hypothetical protein [Candidatus Gottesmanbacteria bacterium]
MIQTERWANKFNYIVNTARAKIFPPGSYRDELRQIFNDPKAAGALLTVLEFVKLGKYSLADAYTGILGLMHAVSSLDRSSYTKEQQYRHAAGGLILLIAATIPGPYSGLAFAFVQTKFGEPFRWTPHNAQAT